MTHKRPDTPPMSDRTSGLEGWWESAHQAAMRLGVSKRTLRRLAAKGRIQRRHDGLQVRYRIPADVLDEYAQKADGHDQEHDRTWPDTPSSVTTLSGHRTDEMATLTGLVASLTAQLADTRQLLGATQARLANAEDALEDAELAWSRLQAELVQTRADVARAYLLLKRHAQSSEPIT